MVAGSIPFKLERDMFSMLLLGIEGILRVRHDHEMSVVRQASIGGVIPDLLVGIWPSTQPPLDRKLSYVDANIVATLEKLRGATRKRLLNELYLTGSGADLAISRLIRSGAVSQENGILRAADVSRRSRAEVVAFEIKLKRWREALRQATTYKHFADRAYVVIDAAQVHSTTAVILEFRRAGIGLILQSGKELQEALPARRSRARTPDKLQALQKLARRLPKDRTSALLARVPRGFAIPQTRLAK